MDSKKIRNSILLIITALIWGIAFVAQSEGGKEVGPFSFNCIRSFIGGLVLIPVIKIIDKINPENKKPKTSSEKKKLLLGGLCCGTALFFASTFQQLGIYMGTSAGKAGFLTACYILLVPVLGLFLGKRCGVNIWIGIVLTVIGLYLLCMSGSLSFQMSDLLVLICALLFAVHILVIDYFSPIVDGVRMSCIQFFVCGIWGIFPMFFSEMGHTAESIKLWLSNFYGLDAWISILYAGIFSCGVAYTFQIIGQNGLNPTVASMLMSLESVFSVVAGWIILNESMNARQLFGCALIFGAIILAQLPMGNRTGKDMKKTEIVLEEDT